MTDFSDVIRTAAGHGHALDTEAATGDELAAFRAWSDKLDSADDDLARDLATIGRERGWIDEDRKIIPPTTPSEGMSAVIRRGAGR